MTSLHSVVTRPEHVQAVFRDSDRHFKARNNDSGYLMGEVLGQCVGLLSGEQWKRLRSRVELPFLHKATIAHFPSITRQVEGYFTALEERRGLSDGKFDPVADIKMLPFLCLAEVVYGDLSDKQISQLEGLAPQRERLFTYIIKGGIGRYAWSRYLPTAANKLLAQFQEDWLKFNLEAYERAKSLGSQAPLVDLWEAAQAGELDRKQVSNLSLYLPIKSLSQDARTRQFLT